MPGLKKSFSGLRRSISNALAVSCNIPPLQQAPSPLPVPLCRTFATAFSNLSSHCLSVAATLTTFVMRNTKSHSQRPYFMQPLSMWLRVFGFMNAMVPN